MASADYFEAVKTRDPYTFIKAEDFFSRIITPASGTKQPASITCLDDDQLLADRTPNPVCSHGRIFRFNDQSLLLVQFIRPKVWRIRFHESNKKGSDFTNYNTRTLVQDTLSKLIETLDVSEQIDWRVELIKDPQYFVLQSVLNPTEPGRKVVVQLWLQKNPFKIIALRSVKPLPPAEKLPEIQNYSDSVVTSQIKIEETPGAKTAIIWQTKDRPLRYLDNATVLSVETSSTANYMGFGEQGGKSLFKRKTFLNYFNFDNMRYQNVYERGPLDDREPLYHSEPYWIEVDGLPCYQSQIATFIDNYSHVCVDLHKGDSTAMQVATRFNDFQCIIIAGDNTRELIQLYTSIVGRPRLKPRYVLGFHQGCYGYDTRGKVIDAINKYRQYNIPIDGMHIDVDVQDNYRTFTIDTRPEMFPQPAEMFRELRNQGIKCSTNITPYINSAPSSTYNTYNKGIEKGYFVVDDRDLDPSAPNASDQRYLEYGKGRYPNPYVNNPNVQRPPYNNPDTYNFSEVFNSKTKPFHGGVFYGWGNGNPGVYPNLNERNVRKWWGEQYKYLFETGLEFVWQDMTSPCMAEEYGDMKSFPFRLLLQSDGWSGDPKAAEKKRAIEIWSLYSYNLHKATYHGLNRLWQLSPQLESRKSKRNFIIGRGSFAGAYRFAGLWTGDNSSTWDFLDISVAQVLALGLSGVTIAGADVGGFEPNEGETMFADPELVIRWHCAYSLLPWFRQVLNHYSRKAGKLFQEPYAYNEYYEQKKDQLQEPERLVYRSVLPVCRYYIRLRYSLMQLLYDTMFENLMTGLPIARAMVITDELDRSLFANVRYHQYMVRNDLLVAPPLDKKKSQRKLYLPFPDEWYQMNLRPDDSLGMALSPKAYGGSFVTYYCPISDQEGQIPYVMPMYIREGGIIPQIEVRECVPDPSYPGRKDGPNPVTINIYPGKDNTYDMYLDDGISRESAPTPLYLSEIPNNQGDSSDAKFLRDALGDEMARSEFCHVEIKQQTNRFVDEKDNSRVTRLVTIRALWNNYKGAMETLIGTEYRVVLWHDPETLLDPIATSTKPSQYGSRNDTQSRATVFMVPVKDAHTKGGVTLEVSHSL
ncbi:glycoside hydrolase family 31 protein [Lepidopterella palustris CBS 459.81]|uniref:alpha-glucosidase n=1 Tax=Lepidopterella palustris CBS 459.81 TaxID=1314670 RepID=A0A8E2ECT3_9PEZI|nr:glycoside hydrolase family 31 protein [Lepidopterella palustris CBS 459.81]